MRHSKAKNPHNSGTIKNRKASSVLSYRLKCAKTANGLSHFVMYGDVPKEKTVL